MAAAPITPIAGALYGGSFTLGAAAFASGVAVVRNGIRAQLMVRVLQGLAPLIGRDGTARARRWKGRMGGTPTRLRVDYDPAAPAHEPEWERKVAKVVSVRLDAVAAPTAPREMETRPRGCRRTSPSGANTSRAR